jgi:glycosyltransferase involved in cell wall biosynthesis
VVVVDDASRDDTPALVDSCIDELSMPARVIRRAQNAGVSVVRNVGCRLAKGDWIQFLDADDLLTPQKIELQLAAVANVSDDVAVVYSPWQHMALEDEVWRPVGPLVDSQVDDETISRILDDFAFGFVGPALIRKSFLDVVGGFDEHLNLGEDIDLMLRIAMAGGRFQRVPSAEPTFFYRDTPFSLWRKSSADVGSMRNLVRMFRRVETYLRTQSQEGVSERARHGLARRYAKCLDSFIDRDPEAFQETLQWIAELGHKYSPDAGRGMRMLSTLVGYEGALRIRAGYRRLRPA